MVIGVNVVTVSWFVVCVNLVSCNSCKEKMLEENMHDRYLTEHPAFDFGCLKHWVSKLAGLVTLNRNKRLPNYTTLYTKGKKSEPV